jgi:hypothetical protein
MEQILDALMNPIEIGKTYGYTQRQNGINTAVIGVAIKAENERVTLGSVKSRTGYGTIANDVPFKEEDKKRSVFACMVFPVKTPAEYRQEQIDSVLKD